MRIRFFTVPYDEELGNFADEELQQFLAGPEAGQILSLTEQFFIYRDAPHWGVVVRYLAPTPKRSDRVKKSANSEDYTKILEQPDWPLYEQLREWRRHESDSTGQTLYIIFHNLQLAKVAHHRPRNREQLDNLKLGVKKTEKYATALLEIVRKFTEETAHGQQ